MTVCVYKGNRILGHLWIVGGRGCKPIVRCSSSFPLFLFFIGYWRQVSNKRNIISCYFYICEHPRGRTLALSEEILSAFVMRAAYGKVSAGG